MAQIDRIINIQISRQTQQISIDAFDIPLILVRVDEAEIVMPNRVETFTSQESVAEMFGETHAATQITRKLLAGDTRPVEWRIGKVAYSTAPVAVVVTGEIESTVVDPTTYVIDAQPTNGTVVIDQETGEYTYTSDIGFSGDEVFSVEVTNGDAETENVLIEFFVSQDQDAESYSQGLQAVVSADDSWYCLLSDARFDQDILSLATVIQSMDKIYATASSDINIKSSESIADIGSQLSQANMTRTHILYSDYADEYPEATWVGTQIIEQPGSNTWAFKTLPGSRTNKLSDTDITVLESKNVNYFTEIKGAAITQTGVMASGDWIDEIIFVDWLRARMQENVFYLFLNRKKVPMTRAGATMIEARIRDVLARGQMVGGIADDTPYTVVSPDPLVVPEQERASRTLGDFLFEARLAGAIHRTVIRGVVTA